MALICNARTAAADAGDPAGLLAVTDHRCDEANAINRQHDARSGTYRVA